MRPKHLAAIALLLLPPLGAKAQIGKYRNDLSIGVNGGYVLNRVGFTPKVNQSMHGGVTGGFSFRYVCEKYFNTICAVQAEVNYARIGWKENIIDLYDQPVVNQRTGLEEMYSRTQDYVQIPVFAHLGWGRESRGIQVYFQVGPQIGFCVGESTSMNFELDQRNQVDRANSIIAQDTMAIENKFDYGIAGGIGIEFSHPKAGHFQLEGRYYYGLGNIYGDSKRDYFAKSNHSSIVIKLTYLFDVVRTRDCVRK